MAHPAQLHEWQVLCNQPGGLTTQVDKGRVTDITYLDFNKYFDMISHDAFRPNWKDMDLISRLFDG